MSNIIRRTVELNEFHTPESLSGYTFTGESGAHTFIINAVRDKVPEALSGSVTAKFLRADGNTLLLQCSISDGAIVATFHQDCYRVKGRFLFTVFLTANGETICVYAATGSALLTQAGQTIDSGETIPDLDELIAMIEDMRQATQDAIDAATAATAAAEGSVRFDEEQTLTTAQKAQAQENLGLDDIPSLVPGVVKYSEAQNLTDAQKAQARQNIGASAGAVKYDESQSLSAAQKTQARTNIGAAADADIQQLVSSVTESGGTVTITKKNGTMSSFVIPQGLTFDGGYVDPSDNTLHLTMDGNDIEDYTPIELPVGGPSSAEYDSSYYLHFYDTNGNEMLGGPFLIEGGGGGAAGYSVRIVNGLPSTTLTVASTQTTILPFTYIETYGGDQTGQNGLLAVQYKLSTDSEWRTYISNQQIPCGTQQRLNISSLLSEGYVTNIRLICSNGRSDEDAVTKTLQYNVTCVAMSISTTFNSAATYTGNVSIPYTCVGRGLSKVVYLYIDGTEYTHVDIGTSHNQSLQLPVTLSGNYAYGAHTCRMWFVTSDGALSNELTFPILYDNGTSQNPIVGATFQDSTIENGETLYLDYVCYTPGQETTDELTVRVYSESEGTETDYYSATFEDIANNTIFTLPISLYPELGTGYIELTSGSTETTLTFTVTEVQTDYDITPVTSGLVYAYKPTGYTNNTTGREEYVYPLTDAVGNSRSIHSLLTGFNWVTDGYLDGESLTLAGSARMNIHLPILTTSFTNDDNQTVVLDAASGATVTTSGRTIEFEFELDNVTNQNSVVFSCLDANGVGFVITPQVCYLLSDGQSPVLDSTGFIENEESIPCAYIKDEKRIRVTFVIQRKRWTQDNRFTSYANIFINGEYANSYLYSEDAIYNGTANIVIGSADCVTKLYEVRMYNRDLSKEEVLRNRMNSYVDIRQRISQNEFNDVLNTNGDVDYVKARYKYPCLLFIGRLSNFKADKSMVGVVLTKPDGLGGYTTEFSLLDQDDASKFVSSIKVQGTSSQRFMRKNFKVYLARNKQDGTGTEKVKYVLKGYDDSDPPQPKSIGESTLCFKMDYMSTDHANTFNANIADTLFNDKPAGSLVQNTVWGFRCLLFNMAAADYVAGTAFEDYPEGTIQFAGDGCLNNDKGNTKSFGLETSGDSGNTTTQQKWEFKDNSNPLCTFKTDRLMLKVYGQDGVSYTRQARNGLESCYPDEGDLDDAGIEPKYDYIQALYTWVYQWANFWEASTTTGTGGTYNSVSYDTERELKKARFKREFSRHFNMEHALVYYLFIEWVALCDNRAKNMFLSCKNVTVESLAFTGAQTSIWDCVNMETGEVDASKIDWENSTFGVWYTDLYDLDSCFGAENSGYIRIPYFADWNYQLGRTGTYQFNGHDSRLWCMFEEAFADEIKARAQSLTGQNEGAAGPLNYAVLRQVHITDNAELVCPAIVNQDMEYKYEDAWTEGYWDYSVDPENPTWTQTSQYKYLQRGSRTEQKESFIYRRSMMLYSKYQCSQFTNDRLAFRCGAAVQMANTGITLSAIQAMYLGVQFGDSGSPVMSAKKAAGETATITSPNDLGRSDNCYIMGASNLTSVSSLAAFHPYEIGLTNAGKLKTLLIGSDASGYVNGDLSSLDTSSCALLDTLNVENCTGFTDSPINLTANTLIREVYAGGSTVPYFMFANGGVLETLELGTPKRIVLLNQPYLTDFSYDSLSQLVMLRVENTPNTGCLDIVEDTLPNLRLGLRLIGINETITDRDFEVLKLLTSSAAQGKRMDANGNLDNDSTAWPVITGQLHCARIGDQTLALMNAHYPDLTITYDQLVYQYVVTFVNYDGTVLYTEYVDQGTGATDPVTAGYISAPTRPSDAQYTYTYNGWDDLPVVTLANTTVTASFTGTVRTYTVRFWIDNETVAKTVSNVAYGSSVMYDDNDEYAFPVKNDEESNYIYNVFNGWDKSTNYITGDLDVYARWVRGALPAAGAMDLHEMNYAQMAAVAANDLAETYFDPMDYFECVMGHDFSYDNVLSETLVSTPTWFDGTGTNVRDTGIKLFDADAPSFTLALDYEFVNPDVNGCLLSCFEEGGNEGFRFRYSSYPNVQWGDTNANVGYGSQRGILTLRHVKGSTTLYVGYNNEGNLIYNGSIVETSLIRTRATSTDETLILGGIKYGENDYDYTAKGWIHWCKIWYGDLGTRDARALASWPHETMRWDYTTLKYRLSTGSGRTGMSFLAHTPFPQAKRMNATSTNVGGWDQSELRPFLNSQVFAAMPTPLQALIKTVRVYASAGNKSTEIVTSDDKIFLAALAEVTTQTDSTYLAEAEKQIPFFTSNQSRIKFCGIPIPDDVQVYSGTVDPTTDSQYTVQHGKFLWIKTNSSSNGYIYVDADYCAKHAVVGNRLITSTDNIAASGAQGGKWILARWWWLRSPYLGNTSGFNNINGNGGSINYSGASNAYALVCGFSF